MKIEDCKVGMKVKNCWDGKIEKRDKKGIISNIGSDYINFKGRGDIKFYPEYFEPVNQFEVGDEVVYKSGIGRKFIVKIWAMRYKKDKNMFEYAVECDSFTIKTKLILEKMLSPLKKRDELEVGDKFKIKTTEGASKRVNEVLGVFEDEYYNQTKYVAKRTNGNYEGFVDVYNSEMIGEIVYE